jgi:hypothetical protein
MEHLYERFWVIRTAHHRLLSSPPQIYEFLFYTWKQLIEIVTFNFKPSVNFEATIGQDFDLKSHMNILKLIVESNAISKSGLGSKIGPLFVKIQQLSCRNSSKNVYLWNWKFRCIVQYFAICGLLEKFQNVCFAKKSHESLWYLKAILQFVAIKLWFLKTM